MTESIPKEPLKEVKTIKKTGKTKIKVSENYMINTNKGCYDEAHITEKKKPFRYINDRL